MREGIFNKQNFIKFFIFLFIVAPILNTILGFFQSIPEATPPVSQDLSQLYIASPFPHKITPTKKVFSTPDGTISLQDVLKEMDDRILKFEGAFSISIANMDITMVEGSNPRVIIQLEAIITNATENPTMFHLPDGISFSHEPNFFWIQIKKPNGHIVNVLDPGFVHWTHRSMSGSFSEVESGESLVYYCEILVPHIWNAEAGHYAILPPGSFYLSLVYKNSWIGPIFDGIEYSDPKDPPIVDLDAWVGTMQSNRIPFQMPDMSSFPEIAPSNFANICFSEPID